MLKTAFLIAFRYNKTKQKNRLVTLISSFSTVGIAIGVAVLIIVLSAMNGFERELNNRVLAVVPHMQLSSSSLIQDSDSLSKKINTNPQIQASSAYIDFVALIQHEQKFKMLQIRAIDKKQFQQTSDLYKFVLANGWQKFGSTTDGILLGSGIAKELNISVNDWVTLLVANANGKDNMAKPQQISVQVVGILRLDGQLDHSSALMPIDYARQIFNYQPTQATGVQLRFADPFIANTIVNLPELYDYPQKLYLESWTNKYGYMYHDIQMVRNIMYLAMILVISIACFNIISTLIMAVKDKQSDIAIMRTLGARNKFILLIFILYGLINGMKGCIIGVIIGCVLALNLTTIISTFESILHIKILSDGIYFVDFLPTELHWTDVSLVLAVALILSFLASIYPAIRATKLQPAVVLSKY